MKEFVISFSFHTDSMKTGKRTKSRPLARHLKTQAQTASDVPVNERYTIHDLTVN